MGRTTARDLEAANKLRELGRCQRSLWYLLTEYLGYGWSARAKQGLVERVHYPICRRIDKNREVPFFGMWMARARHKTTIIIGRLIQAMLIDPCASHRYWHAVDSLAQETLLEIAGHIKNNDRLRWLDPVGVDDEGKRYRIFPKKQAYRWVKTQVGEAQLTINRHRQYGPGTRSPTLRAQGAGSEATGSHINGDAWLDDIISKKTIDRSELTKIQRWTQSTVYPVVDSKLIRCAGTPWSESSVHQLWMADPDWTTVIVPGAIEETDEEFRERMLSSEKKLHFTPSYAFTNPMYGPVEYKREATKMLEGEQKQMRGDFGPQIMCDPEPESERPWVKAAETRCKLKEEHNGIPAAMDGPGVIVVLSDPAPWLQGSWKGIKEKIRADGTKDWWSLAVVRVRARNDLREYILLDGSHSLMWGEEDGCDEACRLMKRWRTPVFFSEDADTWFPRMVRAARQNGVKLRRAKNGGPLKYQTYNVANRKNVAFSALADVNNHGGFYICESVPNEFLHGDGEHTGFLTQARKWRALEAGKNNLRFDDDADNVARCTDAAIDEIAPSYEAQSEWRPWWLPKRDEPEYVWGTKHVRA